VVTIEEVIEIAGVRPNPGSQHIAEPLGADIEDLVQGRR
jgi:hypothetical protein